jgi:aminoglycoside 2''-phosphotransferase
MVLNHTFHLDLIQTVFHERIEAVEQHSGDDFLVMEVNHQWMFRFPKSRAASEVLEIEKKFLKAFEPIAPISVPHYMLVGEGFVGYPKIEGLLLTPSRFGTLPRDVKDKFCALIGSFLTALHTFPIAQALEMGMTEGWDHWRPKAFQTFKQEIAPRLSQKARRNSLNLFEKFLTFQFSPVVIHGDFYPRDHIYFDPQRQELSGVIDFGDLTLEDPACDLKNILSEFGEETLRQVLAHYLGPTDLEIHDRMRTSIQAEPLFEAAYDVQFGYPGRLTHHIRDIEAMFGE